jgi:hypothetical protein
MIYYLYNILLHLIRSICKLVYKQTNNDLSHPTTLELHLLEATEPILIPLTEEQLDYPLWKVSKDLLSPHLFIEDPQELYHQYRLNIRLNDTIQEYTNKQRFVRLRQLSSLKIYAVRRLLTSKSISTIPSRLIASNIPLSEDCCICYEPFSTELVSASISHSDEKAYLYGYVLPCGHRFCYPCIREWFRHYRENVSRGNPPCPTCRSKIDPSHLDSNMVEAYVRAYDDMKRLVSLGHQNVEMDFHKFWYILQEER